MKCAACGHVNSPGPTFCTSCNAFLEWDGATPEPATTPSAESAAQPAAPSPANPVSTVDSGGPAKVRPDTVRRPDERPMIGPPQEPVEEHAPPEPPSGGVPCPVCGAGNPENRTLCVRCGAPLAPPPAVSARPPWWRRLVPRRAERVYRAGERPRRRMWRRPRLVVPVTLLALLGGGWYARPHVTQAVNFLRDRVTSPEEVHPRTARASTAARGHPAGSAFDGFTNRYWAPSRTGPAHGEYLEAGFEQPVRLLKIVVFSGASTEQDQFLAQARPAGVTVTLYRRHGEPTTSEIHVRDQPGQQTFDVRGTDVVRVRLTVDSSSGAAATRRVAVAEVEFFGRT